MSKPDLRTFAVPPPLTKTETYAEPDNPAASFTLTLSCRASLDLTLRINEKNNEFIQSYVTGTLDSDGKRIDVPAPIYAMDGSKVPVSEDLCQFIAALVILDGSEDGKWNFEEWATASLVFPSAFAAAAMDAVKMAGQAVPLAKKGSAAPTPPDDLSEPPSLSIIPTHP